MTSEAKSAGGALFAGIPTAPADSIFGLNEKFAVDDDPRKLNLGVGAYRHYDGKPYVLPVVKAAEEAVVAEPHNMEYLPIIGSKPFLQVSAELVFGEDSPMVKTGNYASIQTLSGTGALRMAFELLYKFSKPNEPLVYWPKPTYANHTKIFTHGGFTKFVNYRYVNFKTNSLDEEGLLADLSAAVPNSIVVLHAVAHNPSGVDPSPEQWIKISKVCKERQLIPVFDAAYLGFASGDPNRDAFSIRHFVKDEHPRVIVCQSYAKNFGLYGHRLGCLTITVPSREEKLRLESQVKVLARACYSNPPIHGARIVTRILGNPSTKAQWLREVKGMADRIKGARQKLREELTEAGSTRSWQHLTDQIGMFCFTGLTPEEADQLREKWHIYITQSGRISMAGVNLNNAKYIAQSIHDITSTSKL